MSDKGDRIIRWAEMCRKLETEEEKIIPFYATSLSENEVDETEVSFEFSTFNISIHVRITFS